MTTINAYLNFNGNCYAAFEFYKSVFGGEFSYVGYYKDMPNPEGNPIPEELHNLIMHISLPISQEITLMGSDVHESFGQKVGFNGNVELMISAENKAEVDALWAKLSEGAKVTMPLQDAFWGDYFGSLTDKFGVRWMFNCPSDK